MKIGVLVDGTAESQAQKVLCRKITIPGVTISDPIYVDMQPKATPAQISKKIEGKIQLYLGKVDRIIILIDLEDKAQCPTAFSKQIERELHGKYQSETLVVVKKYTFENWLIADPGAFRKIPRRFQPTKSFENSIVPNKADNITNAQRHINTIMGRGTQYQKGRDPLQLAEKADIMEMAKNSRSFRRFLRLVGHPKYQDQSKIPCKVE